MRTRISTNRAVPVEATRPFEFRFPKIAELDQDEEWCEYRSDGDWRRVRFHDYDEIFRVPGLYEALFADRLRCESPQRITELLSDVIRDEPDVTTEDLNVLDIGAGNGMVGEELRDIGAGSIVGVDIIPEAAEAAQRDRPDVYAEYLVVDLTDEGAAEMQRLRELRFNCMTTVAALGFNDIPPTAFANAYDLMEDGAWIAFNIKEDFIEGRDASEFEHLIRGLTNTAALKVYAMRRYRHRLAVSGEPLHYIALVGRKTTDIPARLRPSD